jgi:hypothetical protein
MEATVPAQKRLWYGHSFKDILQVFEAMLCFDKWLRKDSYWADHNLEVNKVIFKKSHPNNSAFGEIIYPVTTSAPSTHG